VSKKFRDRTTCSEIVSKVRKDSKRYLVALKITKLHTSTPLTQTQEATQAPLPLKSFIYYIPLQPRASNLSFSEVVTFDSPFICMREEKDLGY
jgi:hypothetical protein